MKDKPLNTCSQESCRSCSIRYELTCHLTLLKLLRFWFFVLPSLLIGGIIIYNHSINSFISWGLIIGLFFLLFGIRVLCTHCPHYNKPSRILRCWANYGVPKFWKYRPQPMNFTEKAILISGFSLVFGYPILFIPLIQSWIVLFIYLLSVAFFFVFMSRYNCSKCINFSCPFNRVNDKVREEFLKYNTSINVTPKPGFDF